MKNVVKTIAMLMMLMMINMVSAQSITNQKISINANDGTTKAANELFKVNVVNSDGIVYINWALPVKDVEGYYLTERSDDGKNFHPLSLKHFTNPPANATTIVAMHYSLEDKTPIDGTVYYKFSKSNKEGDVLQLSTIHVVAPDENVNAVAKANYVP